MLCIVLGVPLYFLYRQTRAEATRQYERDGGPPAAAAMSGPRPAFRDSALLARVVRWLLWANALGALLEIVVRWRRGFDPFLMSEAEARDGPGPARALFVGTAIAFLVWLYRAEANARALGAEDMMVSPGWSVGWFFVPLVQLVMPFIAVRELWKASATPRDWQVGPASPVIALWWACWIGTIVTGNIAFALSRMDDYDAFLAADVMGMVSAVFTIPSAILLAAIVGRIQAMQEAPAPPRRAFRLIRRAAAPASRPRRLISASPTVPA